MVTASIEYFTPPQNYFWHWAENMTVIEGLHGGTICYRNDLISILHGLVNTGLPPLGSVLVVIAGCHEGLYGKGEAQKNIVQTCALMNIDKTAVDEFCQAALDVMALVKDLPVELRSGSARIHLLATFTDKAANTDFSIQSKQIIQPFEAGTLDATIAETERVLTKYSLKKETLFLTEILKKFPDRELLENALRTGIIAPPEPVPLDLVAEEIPAELPLLEQLLADEETTGLARLTQSLIPALHIPMHAQHAGQQPLGGISDITNRGTFDKLLVSELAADDLMFTARLLNNEALYLRREIPPLNVTRQRNVLIDSTLRLWGRPRIYAMAAAMATAINTQQRDTVNAFVLGGDNTIPANLTDKKGVLQAMENLSADLHCIKPLLNFLEANPADEAVENVFITTDAALQQEAYYSNQHTLQQNLKYLISVNRDGALHFYAFVNGHRKLLNTASLNLAELLNAKAVKSGGRNQSDWVPEFYQQPVVPLYYPTLDVKGNKDNVFSLPGKGYWAVTGTGRLLQYPENGKGAIEWMNGLQRGKYYLGSSPEEEVVYLLEDTTDEYMEIDPVELTEKRHVKGSLNLHAVNLYTGHIRNKEQLKAGIKIEGLAYSNSHFYLKTNEGNIKYNCITNGWDKVGFTDEVFRELKVDYQRQTYVYGRGSKRINNGYSVLLRVYQVNVPPNGFIYFDNRFLSLHHNNQHLKLIQNDGFKPEFYKSDRVTFQRTEVDLPLNPSIKGTLFTSSNGSTLLIDSNGMLHAQSSNPSVVSFSMPLILERPTTAWSADGKIAGAATFIKPDTANIIPVQDFFNTYIKAFVEAL